jgi:hypothetical protein
MKRATEKKSFALQHQALLYGQMTAGPIDNAQLFWDVFRKSWRAILPKYAEAYYDASQDTKCWTELIKQAAEYACDSLGACLNCDIEVERELYNRTDVHAIDKASGELIVAFESELLPWGSQHKDWRNEFRKLCKTKAVLRVLSATFAAGSGATFPVFLRDKLDSLRAFFDEGSPCGFCLIFGPSPFHEDPEQSWLAYSLEPDYSVRELVSARPLIPLRVMFGHEGAEE